MNRNQRLGEMIMRWPILFVGFCLFACPLLSASALADESVELAAARAAAEKLSSAGKFKEAALEFDKALKLSLTENGENHQITARILNGLGFVHFKQSKYADAESHYQHCLAIREKLYGKEHHDVAAVLIQLSLVYRAHGKFADQEAVLKRSIEILEKVHGKEHLDVAIALNHLAILYAAQDKNDLAESLHLRCLAIREKALGKEHADVVPSLNNLADLYAKQEKFTDAEPLYKRVLAIREKTLGAEHPAVAATLTKLADLYAKQAKYADAAKLYLRSLAIREKAPGDDELAVASLLMQLANVYCDQGRYDEAQPLILRSLGIKERLHGKEHRDVANSLAALGNLYRAQAKYVVAESFDRRSLAIREKLLGKEHLDVAESLNSLALSISAQGKYTEAEALYQRSLAIKEKVLGKDHRSVSITLNNLGLFYLNQGKYALAEPIFQRSLAIKEKVRGKEHPEVASVLNNLAGLYKAQAKYAEAEDLYRRSLTIREKVLGKDHPVVAGTLINLANLAKDQQDYAAAESLYQRSLAIFEKVHGMEHPDISLACNNLATLYHAQGKYAEAEPFYKRSLAINEKINGKVHPEVTRPLANLANLYKSQERYSDAEPLYQRCLAINEKFLGKEHPEVARALNNLAGLNVNQGKFADAARMETRIRQGTRQFLLRELPSLSVHEQQNFLESNEKWRFHSALSLAYRQAKDAAIIEQSAEWVLNGKAIALEAQTIRSRLEREVTDADGQAKLHEIQTIRAQEAALALNSKQPEAAVKQRELLEARRRELEKNLAQRSSTAAKLANPWVDLADIRKMIPADGILIDIARFRIDQFNPKTELNVFTPARYVAWVIPAAGAGDLRIIDLGDAKTIDTAIQTARGALENTPDRLEKRESESKLEADVEAKLAVVAKLVFDPLKPHLGTAKKLILSPDGDLWLLPWAALPTGKDHYLIEDYTLRFVVTGRDLVDDRIGPKPITTAALILADPDYNLTPAQVAAAAPKRSTDPDKTVAALTRSVSLDTRGIGRVKRLPGTVAEARQAFDKLKTLTGLEPKLYSEGQASEAIVKATKSPQVLVLATHGFFLKKQEVELKGDQQDLQSSGDKTPAILNDKEGKEVENPLLRCGLLLAGANKRAQAKQGEDDGILTGLEIVGLDLRGTQMVVLSACETGLGDVNTGEGVAGLRQAFQLAGAESVLATLWQISDSATSQLMSTFYDELAKGTERSEALTRAQRQFVKERREKSGTTHPYFWASFTLTGK